MRVLVVEDEAAIREAETAYLRRAGHVVREAADGATAWELFTASPFDLVVLDLNLPGLDGLTLCRRIRAGSQVPIMMVTARTTDLDELVGLDSGADDYLRKPFNPRVLVARVRALIRRVGGDLVHAGPLTLDPQRMTLHKDGAQVTLTTIQFNILYRLAARPGTVLSRGQLIEAAHPDEPGRREIFDRTIDAHIRSIRKLVEDDPARPRLVQTVIGSGYRFVAAPRV
ncbi:MAG: response regulator transcription factor [Actinocatenispora sp.]